MTSGSTTVTTPRFPPPGVEAVVFDVVGTLVVPAEPVAATYAAVGRRHAFTLDDATVADRFRAAWRRQENLDATSDPPYATSRTRERERWRMIVEDVFEAGDRAVPMFAELWEHYARPRAWKPLPAGVRLLELARDAGLPVALASNFDERLLAIAPLVAPLSRVDRVFASSEIGWRKPAEAFFRHLERQLDGPPEHLLYVGDDADLDVAAAAAAGWQATLVG